MRRRFVLALYALVLVLPGAAGARVARDTVLVNFDDGRVATLDPAGGRLHDLGAGWTGAWSPDGRRIVLTRDGDLFELSPGGARSRRLTRDELVEFGAAWAPDGKTIAYVQQDPREIGLGIPPRDDVAVIDLASGAAKQLTFDGHSKSELSWTPDGRRLIYVIGGKPLRTSVAVIDARTGEAVQPPLDTPYPIWSPGGRRLAYVATDHERRSLVVAGADGTELRVLFRGARDVGLYDVRWSPSGRFIAFAYGGWSVNHARLEVADVVTGRVRALTSTRGHIDSSPSWSPDSRRVVFARYEPPRNRYAVAVVDRGGGRVRIVLRTTHFGQPLWRPRGA